MVEKQSLHYLETYKKVAKRWLLFVCAVLGWLSVHNSA